MRHFAKWPYCRGIACYAPTRRLRNYDNSVYVVRHDNKFVQHDMRKMARHILPAFTHNASDSTQSHFTLIDFSENATVAACTQRHEISARQGVIVSTITDRPAVMRFRVVCHCSFTQRVAIVGAVTLRARVANQIIPIWLAEAPILLWEPLIINSGYKWLQWRHASLANQNRPQRSYHYACGDFAPPPCLAPFHSFSQRKQLEEAPLFVSAFCVSESARDEVFRQVFQVIGRASKHFQ